MCCIVAWCAQAVYFDKRHHNETSARMWWEKHKAMFDAREQLVQQFMAPLKKMFKRSGRKLQRSASTAARRLHAHASRSFRRSPPQEVAYTNPVSRDPAYSNPVARDPAYSNPVARDPSRPGLPAR
jgi:hypothetical protein